MRITQKIQRRLRQRHFGNTDVPGFRRLVDSNMEFVLIGGFAAGLYGYPVMTEDVDVCLNVTRENLDRLVKAVGDVHPKHRLAANKLPFEVTDANWSMFKNIYLQMDLGILDCRIHHPDLERGYFMGAEVRVPKGPGPSDEHALLADPANPRVGLRVSIAPLEDC